MNLFNRPSSFSIVAAALSACLFVGGCDQLRELFAGKQHKPDSSLIHDHNLHFVQCGTASIEVNPKTKTGTTNSADEMVFLCDGTTQSLTWTPPDTTTGFTVDFGTDSPFPNTTYTSHGKSIGPLNLKGRILNGQYAKAFKYTLTIDGATQPFDPH